MGETLEFISFVPWTIIMQWGNLLILFLLMRKFLFKPVKAILDKREAEINEAYDEAGKAKSEAENMREEYNARMASAREEAGEIVKNATVVAQTRETEIIADAQAKATLMLQKADADIAQEKKKAVNEIKDDISDMAVDIASKIIEREINPEDHEKLITEFIDTMGDAS